MRAAAALLLALCITTSANAATVVSVGDGDTIRVSEGSRRLTIRLACIDAPETSQRPWGPRINGIPEATNSGWFRSDVEGANHGPLRQNRGGIAQ